MTEEQKFGVCEWVPTYQGDSGQINGLAGCGGHTRVLKRSNGLWALFDTQKEAEDWAIENGHDHLLVEPVILQTITSDDSGYHPIEWTQEL